MRYSDISNRNTDMPQVSLQLIEQHILSRLGSELPDYLSYHSLSHTKDVLKRALNIAKAEGVDQPDELLLLHIAALYHDAGFLYTHNDHEEESCRIAGIDLPAFGLCPIQVERVKELICATKVPQVPLSPLACILCDADLDYLGRDDFFEIGQKLYTEFLHQGIVSDEDTWNRLQVSFLESHHYFTTFSRENRAPQKAIYLEQIKAKLQVPG